MEINKYQNGKIYKVISINKTVCYIGSTINSIEGRLEDHKYAYKSYLKGASNYYGVFELLELGDVTIELIENYPCNSKRELLERESYWVSQNNCVKQIRPLITDDERKQYDKDRYENNKYIILERNNKYRIKNRDKVLAHKNEKHICTKCGVQYTQDNFRRHERTKYHKEHTIS